MSGNRVVVAWRWVGGGVGYRGARGTFSGTDVFWIVMGCWLCAYTQLAELSTPYTYSGHRGIINISAIVSRSWRRAPKTRGIS